MYVGGLIMYVGVGSYHVCRGVGHSMCIGGSYHV